MNEKVTGNILLWIGLVAMILPTISVLLVFMKVTPPIEIFDFPPISFDMTQALSANLAPGIKLNSAPMEIMSADMLNQTANIVAHVFLMGFIINLGYRLASLGIQLLRPIKVEMK